MIKPDVRLLIISVRVAGGGEVGEGEVDVLLFIKDVLMTEGCRHSSQQGSQPEQPEVVEIIFHE